MKQKIDVIEVGPRDGFQSVKCAQITTEQKLKVIDDLVAAGVKHLEYTSFVSPKAIPQMADAKDVMLAVKDTLKAHGVRSVALVPNARGVETALECGVDELTYVVSVSEKHNMANVRRTPDESLAQFKELAGQYGHQMRFRLALATALGCPFGEEIRTERVAEMVRFGLEQGCEEVMIADTVGMSNPKRTYDLMEALVKEFGPERFVMHLHDTRGLALANTLACMQLGVHKFESAAGGLGGCPFAPGAAGNVATEDVLNMMSEMGIATGIDNDVLHEAVELIQANVHANIVSHLTPLYKKAPCV